jgi:hypothetical protein
MSLLAGECPTTEVKLKVALHLENYRQPVRFRANPLEAHGQIFFKLNPYGHSPYVTSSLTRRWVCLL